MLDCEPSDIEEPSEEERGGVPAPELEVQVLERDLDGNGRVKTDVKTTNPSAPKTVTQPWNSQPDESSPSATKQLSSKLWRSNNPCCIFIILSSPNWNDDTDAMDGFSTTRALLGDSWRSTFLKAFASWIAECLRFSMRTQGDASINETRERRRTCPPPSICNSSSARSEEP